MTATLVTNAMPLEVQLVDASATERFGAALAHTATWHLPRTVSVYLCGELGAGKTTLARGFLRALGVQGTVRSPSYTLLETYEVGTHGPGTHGPGTYRVLHLDLYRLRSAEELETLGLRDECRPGTCLLVEWPERAMDRLPPADLVATLEVLQPARRIAVAAKSMEGTDWLSRASDFYASQV